MNSKWFYFLAGAVLGVLGAGLLAGRAGNALQQPTQAASATADDRAGDREAIVRLVEQFRKAFERGDAKAIAALYTQECEYYEDSTGEAFRGQQEVERAYTELFKERPASKIEIVSQSIRFVGHDTAVEEGLARLQPIGSELPRSARYSCICVREDGRWKVALEREWGVTESRLEDLSWLIGDWAGKGKDRELQTSFHWNPGKTLIVNKSTVKENGRVTIAITQRIGVDPQTGQIRSWIIDGTGGRGQAVWVRDGDSWLLDATGVLAGGAQTTAVNILSRTGDDAFTWRSVERRVGGVELPATAPVKVARVKSSK
jgi:uncharacterized protein (TIGR02246 family)